MRESGAPIAAIRYEDLQTRRDEILRHLLERMALPAETLNAARRGFDSDAQAGTAFARDDARGNTVALPEAMQATVIRLLSFQTLFRRPGQVIPGTIRPKHIN